MRILLILLLIFEISSGQNLIEIEKNCPPCNVSKNKLDYVKSKWLNFAPGDLIKVNSLTPIKYSPSNVFFNNNWTTNKKLLYVDQDKVEGFKMQRYEINPWWMRKGLDPWSDSPHWGWKGQYKEPNHNFDECVDDRLRWMCGYSFVVDLPTNYRKDIKYPLLIFLHGTVKSKKMTFYHREKIRTEIFSPQNDPFVYAAPIKLEIDWDPKKIKDVIENIKKNINIDPERIYLTGLSMGGRGSFIVASELTKTFSAIMAVSPHHGPYSYVKLAHKLKKLPILITHGEIDKVSSFQVSKKMSDSLKSLGGNVIFKPRKNIGHNSWYEPYKDSTNIKWLLSWKKE